MKNEDKLEQIEKYLLGEMSPEDAVTFEQMLEKDEELLIFTENHAKMIEAFMLVRERQKLKNAMEKIHLHNFSFEKVDDKVGEADAEIDQPKVVKISYWKIASIAASVALIISLGAVFTFQAINGGIKNSAFKSLRRDLDKIKKSHNILVQNLEVETEKKGTVTISSFGGSGFAISNNGYIVTSYHVVKGGDSVFVENSIYQKLRVKVLMVDPKNDIAILKVEDSKFNSWENVPFVLKTRKADLGESVFTLGYPKDEVVYGEGSISSNNGYNGDSASYQISIPINPGNSGGPLLDDKGNIIGIISGKETETDATGFAIKTGLLLDIISKIENDTTLEKPILKKSSVLNGLKRPQQLKKMQEFVFNVKVYN
jgi:S1-C subfamily serine protease